MTESLRLGVTSVTRRWRRNLISLLVVAVGAAALIVLSSVSIGSAEAVTARLDEATSSRTSVQLPNAFWDRTEASLTSIVDDQRTLTGAGTLVSPADSTEPVLIRAPWTSRTVEATVGVATPSGLRLASAEARSGGLGADAVVSSIDDAVYLGSLVARELDYHDVSSGRVMINGRPFAVLGVVSSEEAWISASVLFPPRAADAAGYLPAQRVLSIASDQEMTPQLQEWIAMKLSPTAPDEVTVLSSPSAKELREDILERGNSLTGLVGIIAAITAFLTLAATTFASLVERRREMGLYLALGYGRGFIAAQVVVEGTIVGVLGGAVGLLAGVMTAAGISAASFPSFHLLPLLLLLPVASGLLGLLSSLLPALSATRVMPSELLRD